MTGITQRILERLNESISASPFGSIRTIVYRTFLGMSGSVIASYET